MARLAFVSMRLACRDWLHEFSLSLCGVLALASMLAPLLVLHGVRTGIVERLREHLMRDPAVLVVIPEGSQGAGFDEAFLEDMAREPACAFCIGRTRSVASEVQLSGTGGALHTVSLEATAPGDPMLERHGILPPQSAPGKLALVLTAVAADRLKVKAGDSLKASLGRKLSSGRLQSLDVNFTVTAVLPAVASGQSTAFVDMQTLLALQDFRDAITSDLLGMEGERPAPEQRRYASFRAYAPSLDDVERLEAWFVARDVPVKTRSRDIANVKNIDSTLSSVILLIASASCAGFFAFMASTAQAAVRRKWKVMGMLRLIGFTRLSLLVYPVSQSLVTAGLGCLLAFGLYGVVAYAIDVFFAAQSGGESVCFIPPLFFLMAFVVVEFLAILASLQAALRASSIEPSAVIRES